METFEQVGRDCGVGQNRPLECYERERVKEEREREGCKESGGLEFDVERD